MVDRRKARMLKWGLFVAIALINISVYCIWIPAPIPDLHQLNEAQRDKYRNIIRAMSKELQNLANMSHPRRVDLAMSWQALSRLNMLRVSQDSSRMPTPTPSIHSVLHHQSLVMSWEIGLRLRG